MRKMGSAKQLKVDNAGETGAARGAGRGQQAGVAPVAVAHVAPVADLHRQHTEQNVRRMRVARRDEPLPGVTPRHMEIPAFPSRATTDILHLDSNTTTVWGRHATTVVPQLAPVL